MTKVDDPEVARKILDQVNAMNTNTAATVGILATIFAAIPQSVARQAALFAIMFAALYYLQGKIPEEVE